MEFSRQEYWSGYPFPSPGDLLNPGIEAGSPAFQAGSLLSEPCSLPSVWEFSKEPEPWHPTSWFSFKKYLCYYYFLAALGFSCSIQDLPLWPVGFSWVGSVVVVHALSCLAVGGILIPLPGIKLMCPALEGRFSTTGPPGKSHVMRVFWIYFLI